MKDSKVALFLIAVSLLALTVSQAQSIKKLKVRSSQASTDIAAVPAMVYAPIKFEETFGDSQNVPAGWMTFDEDGSGTGLEYVTGLSFTSGGTVAPQVGQAFWFSNFQNSNGFLIDEWLTSPMLPVVENGDSLHFYGGAIGGSFDDSIQVWVALVDPAGSVAAFDQNLGRLRMDGPIGNWTKYSVDVSLYAGINIWLGLRYWHTDGGPTGGSSDNVWLDHIIMTGTTTGIGDDEDLANSFVLKQNYPNPFNPATTIRYNLHKTTEVTLKIYNLSGQVIRTLVSGQETAGAHQVVWDGKDNSGNKIASGIYLYKLQTQNQVQTRKMVLLK